MYNYCTYMTTCICATERSRLEHWQTVQVTLAEGLTHFVVVAERGGDSIDDDEGDIALDDFWVDQRRCDESKMVDQPRSLSSLYVHVLFF